MYGSLRVCSDINIFSVLGKITILFIWTKQANQQNIA